MSKAWRRRTRRRLIVIVIAAGVVAFVVWCYSASPRGMIAAWVDGARGHNEVKTYGLPMGWDGEYARLLREKYGVEVNWVAGCVVTRDLVEYVDGYNSVATARIEAEYGKDIFAECTEEARAAWELANPRKGAREAEPGTDQARPAASD
jgi:hypothetical protein